MKNADMPATPMIDDKISTHCTEIFYGLTKREAFAMAAMAAWIQHHGAKNDYGYSDKFTAESAVSAADALLKELDK